MSGRLNRGGRLSRFDCNNYSDEAESIKLIVSTIVIYYFDLLAGSLVLSKITFLHFIETSIINLFFCLIIVIVDNIDDSRTMNTHLQNGMKYSYDMISNRVYQSFDFSLKLHNGFA